MSAVERLAPTVEAASWASLAAICRRVSLFRALGKSSAAQSVHDGEFSPLLSTLGISRDDARVVALIEEEERRVTDASLVAQLLAPLLQAQAAVGVPSSEDKLVTFESPSPPASGPLSIADMIDGMLAQERRSSARRR